MFYGVTKVKKNLRSHIKIMSSAMIWDVLLILQIEITRSAINTASKGTNNPTALLIHLFFAIGSVLLYGAMTYTGRKVLKGEAKFKKLHKKMGIITLVFRVLTFVTSFFAVTKEIV
jgi:hypothetical protein